MKNHTPFKIEIPQPVLDDLKNRIKNTIWPDQVENSGWTIGTSIDYMKELVDYWLNKYDWRKAEAELNKFNHFTAMVDGIKLHFIHEPSKNPDATPIMLLHGWPDSFYRYHKVIDKLKENFHVVVPSMPGMGYSERRAFPVDKMAELYKNLMTKELGYNKFISAGGDGGTLISMSLAQNYPEVLIGYHITDVGYPDHTTDFASLTPTEQAYAGFIQQWWMSEGAFNMVQATKPQTLAYAMNDSPVGLAAWIMGFMGGMGIGDDIDKRLGRDEILTNITIFWVTETIGSSFRIYYEMMHAVPSANAGKKSEVPAAVATEITRNGAPRLPRDWAARRTNLVQFHDMPYAGHFAAWEDPEYYVKDILDFREVLKKEYTQERELKTA